MAVIGELSEACGKKDPDKPMCFRGDPWCCTDHRKLVERQQYEAIVVWDDEADDAAMSFMARHDHVHGKTGLCLKNRYGPRCPPTVVKVVNVGQGGE